MREVPESMSEAWLSEAKFGDQKPVVRATVQRQNLRRYEYDTAWAQGGDYNDRHRSGHFTSFIFGDPSGQIEIRNIKTYEWDRSLTQDSATCSLTLVNSELTPIGSPKDNPTSPDEFDKPGYMTYNRGEQTESENRWGYDTDTGWNGRLVPDMTVKTYEGYGVNPDVHPSIDENLMQSGVWLIDKVTYSSDGGISVEMRDLARILLDNVVFPPAIPFSEYPLSWIHNHSENVPARDVTGGEWKDRLNRFGSASSSNDIYVGEGFTNEPFNNYVGPSGGVDGHHASHAIMNHDGEESIDLYWRSSGQDAYNDFVWWQFNVDSGTMPVGALRLRMAGGPYRVYISIHNGDKWVGKREIHYKVDGETEGPAGIDIGAKIPFVKSVIADRYFAFDAILPRAYNAKKIRLTFTKLRQGSVGEHPFRAGLRELKVYTASSKSDLDFRKGHKLKVIGNYGDYTSIVKWVAAWAGWYWPPHSTGDDFVRVDSDTRSYISFINPDPILPKGRVWGDFMKTGTHGEADLTVDLFDKKPLMDIINYVRDLTGFVFFIDETGGMVWRMPNLWSLGNYLSPADILDTEDNRLPGKRGRGGRSEDILTLDEDETLFSYSTTLDSGGIRDRVFVANAVGGVGVVVKGFNPYPVGFRRVAGWTDQHFKNKREARIMAGMITVQQMFGYRTAQSVIPGNPAIQIDDQIRIFERVTNETFFHYVLGIKSSMDMDSGEWTYTLTTHWLGEEPEDAWVIDPEVLDDDLKAYLNAVGYTGTNSEDHDELEGVDSDPEPFDPDPTDGNFEPDADPDIGAPKGGEVDNPDPPDDDPPDDDSGGGSPEPGDLIGMPDPGDMYLGVSKLIAGRESYMGQRMGLHRTFWNDSTASTNSAISTCAADIAVGRVPWISFKLSVTWASAAAGGRNAWFSSLCSRLNDIGGGPIWIIIHHEPNGDGQSAAAYIAMYAELKAISDAYPQIWLGPNLSAGYYQMGAGGWRTADWFDPAACDYWSLDIYNPYTPANGKAFTTVDQSFRLGGIAQCLAQDSTKPIAIAEWAVRTKTSSPGLAAAYMQDAYDYGRTHNVVGMAWFDSDANSPDGGWLLDKNYLGNAESPAERLVKYKQLLTGPNSVLIPPGGLS